MTFRGLGHSGKSAPSKSNSARRRTVEHSRNLDMYGRVAAAALVLTIPAFVPVTPAVAACKHGNRHV
jgi:hypothetical protein